MSNQSLVVTLKNGLFLEEIQQIRAGITAIYKIVFATFKSGEAIPVEVRVEPKVRQISRIR